jgi:CRISPR-associated exonuclease Cas4
MVRVSDLLQYLICPRHVYFISRGHEFQPEKGVERSVLKEVAFSFPAILSSENGEKNLVEEIDFAVKKLGIEEAKASEIKVQISSKIDLEKLQRLPLDKITPFRREYMMSSEKLHMSGCADKIVKIGDELIPSVLKTGECPLHGVWRSDRLQLAAYAMLMEEEFDSSVERGFVEYLSQAELREMKIADYDRRFVKVLVKKVEKIKDDMPRGTRQHCDNCQFRTMCKPRVSLLSKILGG